MDCYDDDILAKAQALSELVVSTESRDWQEGKQWQTEAQPALPSLRCMIRRYS